MNFLLMRDGKTSYQLAKETGLTQAAISNWRKTGRLPDGKNLIVLANYFDVSLDFLVGRSDIPEIAGRSVADKPKEEKKEKLEDMIRRIAREEIEKAHNSSK